MGDQSTDSHEPECRCVIFGGGEGAAEKLRQQGALCMLEHGYYVHYVFDGMEDSEFVDIHTHGLTESFGLPEMQLVIPLEGNIAYGVLEDAVRSAKENPFVPGEIRYGIVRGMAIAVALIPDFSPDELILRIILPDAKGDVSSLASGPFGWQRLVRRKLVGS